MLMFTKYGSNLDFAIWKTEVFDWLVVNGYVDVLDDKSRNTDDDDWLTLKLKACEFVQYYCLVEDLQCFVELETISSIVDVSVDSTKELHNDMQANADSFEGGKACMVGRHFIEASCVRVDIDAAPHPLFC
ncbi:hypothetical protein FRX31_007188 [Thalictrum thalictroides]|uniref:Uncharacterized protein n=1 Tax=Thalictrum thalictroides TaxID=46969 RepID=A0A7J6X1K7_THATH|nr:hypothetical protein FRX31_007188 [Thalictrum thalictroides]